MKIFSSELGHNYQTYTFGYAQYGKINRQDSLTDIYDSGYLPYSGAKDARDVFYMSRSARVPLLDFVPSSENRRIAKKFDGMFEKKRIPFSQFTINEAFLSFCLGYFASRHGEFVMPRERLQFILDSGLITTVVEYRQNNQPAAYVLEVERGEMCHFWFSFYDPQFAKQSLGIWLMLDCIRSAKERSIEQYYLGTVYGKKALYKTNFKPLHWWTGQNWNADIAALRNRAANDDERIVDLVDEWKESKKLF